ncbi:cilia- and flagella-associated protein 74-like isoform X2 [Mercenaria mercenaria]|uniref:cilia- and flagella-associated protein 74-like isoform X2 n=1 Tax=Mercenaria mercenaria TaxID=6596 RepID=UPI00234E5934|nr:cilia- and flagella-associated protein 74-like isoform X2 [Mercenaria mercenaria]
MDFQGLPQDFGMPLLDGDDFFKNLDTMEQDFMIEGEIADYDDDGELDLGGSEGDDDETYIESPDYPDTPVERLSRQEQLRMMHLRSHLNQLTEKVKHHQYMTEKTRDELKQCRSKISELEAERNQVRDEIQQKESAGNQSAIHRLRSQHDRLSQEISDEKQIEKLICDRLDKEEYELNKVEVERGKFLLAEDELVKKEDRLAKEKTDLALRRLRKEERKALQAEKNMRNKQRVQQEIMKERQRQSEYRARNAKESHEKHSRFVDDTMNKLKQRQEEENNRYKENMQRKMDMLLKLKSDIQSNRENLKALHARDKAAGKKEEQKLEQVRQKILDEGGNPDQILLIQKRISDFEKQKSNFESEQMEKQASIMGKILLEEERMKRRKQQQPLLWDDPKREKSKILGPPKKKPLKTFQEYTKLSVEEDLTLDLRDSLDENTQEKLDDEKLDTADTDAVDRIPPPREVESSDSSDDDDMGETAVDLAKPEFEGLWDHHKPYTVPKDTDSSPLKTLGASKMDKAILNQVLEKHRAGIVVKQVAAGREFSGCPFYSKPDVIHFKDFDVGKSYKKKVTLTNVSYTVNYCKYIDITERLKDFINIHFDPPGQMSAGLTCEMLVTFKPMINEDLEGEVKFLSQTGPFSIPLKCTTKKCDLSVDMDTIQFGTTVIDETLKRTFTLTNKGALGTTFEFFKLTGMKAKTATSAQTSLGRMTTGVESTQPLSPEPTEADKSKKETEEKKTEAEASKVGEESQAAVTSEGQEGTQETTEGQTEVQPEEGEAVGDGSPDLLVSEIGDYGTLDGMKAGPISTGEIGPFSSTKLEIIWNPSVPGKVDSEFLVTFSDPLSERIPVRALGNAIDVPVWVQRQTVDLKICMLDRLYQDTIVVSNRATTALRLKFEVCKELRNHLELLPKTGYIQAQSQFSAQLKFLPRQSLFEEGGKYFDKETGVLEAPMTIRVADQTAPVPFTVTAVVTNSDMVFDTTDINFGDCTIYESTKTTIKLTNKSILPQEFGFVGHPEYVEVQPNDGFGTLLPLETIELDVIFSPKKARDYKFELNCKSLINREFKIQCKGVGVHPPLDLSKQVIHFAATSLYDVSTAALHVINSHTSMNEFTHPVPRIGKGEIAPVGPTSFEFVVPEGAPVTISPSVGTIMPGEKTRVQVRFAPTLNEDEIRTEAVRMATRQMEQQADKEYKEALKRQKEAEEAQPVGTPSKTKKTAPAGGGKKGAAAAKGAPPKGKQTPGSTMLTVTGPQPVVPPKPEEISKDSSAYAAAVGSLLRQYKGKFQSLTVPCYVASGETTNPGELPYSVSNTLYLEIHCPTVKPPLVVISDSGRTVTDFGEVSLGQNIFKSITIQNISSRTQELSATALDTMGPFQVMNAFRVLPPDATHTMLVSFTPNAGRVFQEVLSISCLTAQLHISLVGKGVSPLVSLSPAIADDGIMDMGAVLAGEYLEKTFKMQNTSSLSIDYSIRLESLSLLRHAHAQELPKFLEGKSKTLVGVQNNNGQNVFDLVPAEGTIAPGGNVEITVTFAPDHASDNYSDGVKIELFGKEECQAFQIKGVSKQRIMFIDGGDPIKPEIESLAVKPTPQLDDDELKQQMPSVLMTFRSVAKDDAYQPANRDILIGCVRTMAVSQKKDPPKPGYRDKAIRNGEFTFENVQLLAPKGFSIDPQKGMVEAGILKPVTITWTPPAGYDPNQVMEASVVVTLKGDATEQYKVMLHAMVVSE